MALDTPIPTPFGWTTMGELEDGDEVYSQDGTLTKIVRAHPVMFDRQCYRIRFADGASFVCDAGHLWFTRTEQARRSIARQRKKRNGRELTLPRGTDQRHKTTSASVVTTEEINQTLLASDGRGNTRANHAVPAPLALSGGVAWPIQVKPYTLGAWLGDGRSESAGLTSADSDVPRQIELDGYEVHKNSDALAWYIHGLKGQLREAELLNNKHIPKDCLRSSYADRLSLLQGLMDTDGHAGADGTAEFCTIREGLAQQVAELVRTLGMRANLYVGRATINGRDCGPKYRVCFAPSAPVFRLGRKSRTVTTRSRGNWRKIVSVEMVESVPVRCITVDHPSGLYLVGEQFTVTHNTAWARFVMVHTAKQHDRRWCVFSPESQPWEQFAAQCAEVFVGKPFYQSRASKVPVMDDADIASAEAWLEDRVTMLVCDAEDDAPTVDWLLERARACVLRDGATDFVVDPWNEVDQSRGDMSETDFIGRCLQRFKAFALRHGCNVWIVAHPAKPSPLRSNEKRLAPGPYDISGSAHWANKPDLGLTIHSPVSGVAELHVWKSRYRRWGQRNAIAKMDYDPHTGRYSTTKAELDEPPSHWLDMDT